jgi:hypothetical protein
MMAGFAEVVRVVVVGVLAAACGPAIMRVVATETVNRRPRNDGRLTSEPQRNWLPDALASISSNLQPTMKFITL